MSGKISRRDFLRTVGLTAGAAALAACAPQTAVAPAEQQEEPESKPASQESVTLEFWTFNDYAVGKALELFNTFIGEFQSANANIKVNITGKPGTDILAGLIAGAGSGQLPDSVQIQLGAGGDLLAASALADVNQYWMLESEDFRKQFNTATMELLTQEGKCWGLPFSAYATILFRNLKVLEKAGIDPAAGIKNWDDYLAQVEKVGGTGIKAMGKALGDGWIHKHWYGGVTGAKKDVIAPDGKSVLMEADKYTTLFEFLLKCKPNTAGSLMYDQATTDLFTTDQLAFVSMGPWLSPTLDEAKAKSGLEWDAVLIPGMTETEHGGVKGGEFTCVMPTKNVEAAWKWCAFVSDYQQTARFAGQLGRFMANNKALAQPEVMANALVQLTKQAFDGAVLEGPLMKKVATGWGQPETDYGTLVDQGSMKPAEAAEKMIEEMNAILAGG